MTAKDTHRQLQQQILNQPYDHIFVNVRGQLTCQTMPQLSANACRPIQAHSWQHQLTQLDVKIFNQIWGVGLVSEAQAL